MTNSELEQSLRALFATASFLAHERRKSARKGRNAKNIEIADHMCSCIDRAGRCVEALEMSMPMVFKSYADLMGDE